VASTHSALWAMRAALIRPLLLRVTLVGGLLVAGWLLGSAPAMALPGSGGLDSPLSGQQDDSAEHGSAVTGADPGIVATTATVDAISGLTGSADSPSGRVVEPEPEPTSGAAASADQPHSTEDATPVAGPVADLAEPVTELAEPAARLAEPVTELAEPVTELAEPVVSLAEPVTELAEPVVSLAEPVTELAEPVVGLAGGVVGLPERPAPDGSAVSSEAATQPAATPPVPATEPSSLPSGPVLGPLATDVVPPGAATAVAGFGPTSAADSTTSASTVDGLMTQGPSAAPPCSPGGSSAGGPGSAPALPGGNGAVTPPAGPVGALLGPPVTAAPGLLAQRPSTSPD
jgi:hypothetical protein